MLVTGGHFSECVVLDEFVRPCHLPRSAPAGRWIPVTSTGMTAWGAICPCLQMPSSAPPVSRTLRVFAPFSPPPKRYDVFRRRSPSKQVSPRCLSPGAISRNASCWTSCTAVPPATLRIRRALDPGDKHRDDRMGGRFALVYKRPRVRRRYQGHCAYSRLSHRRQSAMITSWRFGNASLQSSSRRRPGPRRATADSAPAVDHLGPDLRRNDGYWIHWRPPS